MRKILVAWHRWFGLLASVWLLAMALTGVPLVFKSEIERALNPELYTALTRTPAAVTTTSGQIRLDPQAWLAQAEGWASSHFVRRITFPKDATATASIALSPLPGSGAQARDLFIDPINGHIQASRLSGQLGFGRGQIMNTIFALHFDLLLGSTMLWLLGLVALLWLLDHLVSLAISFTVLRKWWHSFRVRFSAGGYKRTFDYHRAGGLWLFPITFMFALSSLYFNWYDDFLSAVDSTLGYSPRFVHTLPQHSQANYQPEVGFAQAYEIAQSHAGEARPYVLTYLAHKQVYEARFFDPRDRGAYGRRMVVVDAGNGQVLSDKHSSEGAAGNAFVAWLYPLHTGQAFGLTGRVIILLTGVLLVVVIVTGYQIWWRKRRARLSRAL